MAIKMLFLRFEPYAENMMKKLILPGIFVLVLTNLSVQAQSDFFSTIQTKSEAGGELKINQGQEIFQATNDHIYYVKNRKGTDIYRIWIFTGNMVGQEKARAKFVSAFPDYATHTTYNAPDFQLFVGDFYRRNEAKRALKEIKKVFPNAFDRVFYSEIEEDGDYIKLIK